MHSTRIMSIGAAVSVALLPAIAHAADDVMPTDDAAYDTCMNDCSANCANAGTGAATPAPQKTTVTDEKKIDTGAGTSEEKKVTTTEDSARVSPDEQAAAVEAARAEERARAAEEFRAEEQRLNDEHEADLERVRTEAQQRADEQIAHEQATQQQKIDMLTAEQKEAERAAKQEERPLIEHALLTPVGIYGQIGGGVGDFTQPSASGTTSVGGNWDARIGIGTRSIFGIEADYAGGSRDISALGLSSSAFLVNNGVEGIARLNVPVTMTNSTGIFEPYTFGGVGWQHYSLANAPTNTSDVSNTDDIMTVPLGVGVDLGLGGFTLDGRWTYRHAFFSDLLGSPTSSFAPTSLNSWELGAGIGFEF